MPHMRLVQKVIVWSIVLTGNLHTLQAQRTPPEAYPSGTQVNHIRMWDVVKPVTDSSILNLTAPVITTRITTQYFDGLGRGIQTVVKQGSLETNPANPSSAATAVDMVSAVVYDEFGREQFKYLGSPATTTGGNTSVSDGLFKLNPFQQQAAFYDNSNTANPLKGQGETFFYGQIEFESSPLNRVNKTMSPGNSWIGSNKGLETKYWLNTDADTVRIWNVTNVTGGFGTYNTLSGNDGIYAAGELYKNVTVDEHGKQVLAFTDKAGKIILKKVQLTATADNGNGSGYTGWLCTYYFYDELSNLRCVVQPKGVELLIANGWDINAVNGDIVNEQCFRYEYDHRNRMIMKKVPGAGVVYMVYDTRDRLVMTQDANMRVAHQWLVTFYDGLNRPVMTGLMTYNISPVNLQDSVTRLTATPINPQPGFKVDLVLTGTHSGDKKALRSIIMENGFESQSNVVLTAEIVSGPGGEDGETNVIVGVAINKNPIPAAATFNPLTKTFYDNYDWRQHQGNPLSDSRHTGYDTHLLAASNNTFPYPESVTQSNLLNGLITGAAVKKLGTDTFLYTVNFYDEKARLIQTQSSNITGESDITTTQYSFAGQPLIVINKTTKGGHHAQTTVVVTRLSYDDLGRVVKTEKKVSNTFVNGGNMTGWATLSGNQYDALGQLKKKKLATEYNNGAGLETLAYDYNIRGWLLGANRDYLVDNASGNYFGFELGYDKNSSKANRNFNQVQYNGNINGMVWKSMGDGIQRKYDFGYDAANRLLKGDFEQHNTDGSWNNSTVNYNVKMGDGSNPTSAYDANGNIMAMNQWGLKLSSSSAIDDLQYEYYDNSNKLRRMLDNQNDNNSKLGDFKYDVAGKGFNDYGYDLNGNLITDLNKKLNGALGSAIDPTGGVGAIRYNHLNLPEQIIVAGKGQINYKYDATGIKLSKTVVDNTTGSTTTTLYIGGFEYKNDTLQQLAQEEGRIRYAKKYFANGDSTYQFFYDYFLKDHLGNVRMVLTEQKDTTGYFATMELGAGNGIRNKENELFSNINTSAFPAASVPGGYPVDNSLTNPNDYVAKLNGSGQKVGPSIVLKVMSGDVVDLAVKSFYRPQGSPGGNPNALADILISLADGVVSVAGETKGTLGQLSDINTSPLLGALNPFRTQHNPDPTGKPKAYLNWILLDEQFKYVGSYPQSGAMPVGDADALNTLAYSGINITKSGYLYIYVSNETQNWDVFFDNLAVKHYTGPILEETHYYPFGLTMAGISSKALSSYVAENKYKYNGIEKEDGLGIEIYDAQLRELDPQLGRWWQIDPKIERMEMWSPYASNYDNPIRYSDPLGDEGEECCKGLKKVFASVSGAVIGTIDNNIPGSNLRGAVASSGIIEDPEVAESWNKALDVADQAGIVQGVGEGTAGGGIVAGSIGVTAATGGLSIEVTGPAAATGTLMVAHGAFVVYKSADNLASQNGRVHIKQTQTGSYTNTHQSGNKYHGKGTKSRAEQSASKKVIEYTDPLKKSEWKPAKNEKEAFKAEARRIRKDGGIQNPKNYNKRNSPGEKILQEEEKKRRKK
jgi:RHS repeat-associated protein